MKPFIPLSPVKRYLKPERNKISTELFYTYNSSLTATFSQCVLYNSQDGWYAEVCLQTVTLTNCHK